MRLSKKRELKCTAKKAWKRPTKEEVQIRLKENEARGIFEPTAKRLLVCAHATEWACLDGKQTKSIAGTTLGPAPLFPGKSSCPLATGKALTYSRKTLRWKQILKTSPPALSVYIRISWEVVKNADSWGPSPEIPSALVCLKAYESTF